MKKLKISRLKPSQLIQSLIIFIVVFGLFYFQSQQGWFYLGKINLNFGDLKYILDRADCVGLHGRSVYQPLRENDNCTNYIYGYPLIYILHLLHISSSATFVIGIIGVIFVSILISTGIIYLIGWDSKLTLFASVFSPPVILLVQRGNLDIGILFLICLSSIYYFRNYKFMAFILIIVSSLFKFYTLPLAFLVLFTIKSKFKISIATLIFTLTTFQVSRDIHSVPFIPWDAKNSFGNPIWGEYLAFVVKGHNSHENKAVSQLIGLFVFVIVLKFLTFLDTKVGLFSLKMNFKEEGLSEIFYLATTIVFLTCFFSGINVDYRLVFLVFSLVTLGSIVKGNQKIKISIFVLFLITSFISFNVSNLQPIGDLSLEFLVAIQVVATTNLIILRFPKINNRFRTYLNPIIF